MDKLIYFFSAPLEKITLDVRRDHELRLAHFKVGSKWGDIEEITCDSGAIQLWRVLEKEELVRTEMFRR